MGLIKAAVGSIGGVMADQWKEFFCCDALDSEVLVKKARNKVSSRSSNTKGEDNIISNGSVIAVADGQCMIIVDQGQVVEFCAVPGEYTYDMSSEPSLFSGSLGKNIVETFKNIGKRFSFGGGVGKDQRVYFVNTKEISKNKYGTSNPIPFRVVDNNIGLDIDISIRCHGEYSYRIIDPLLFYTNVCANVKDEFRKSDIESTLKGEFITALQPAMAKISEMGIRYSSLPGHTTEIVDVLNDVLSEKWKKLRGIEVFSIGMEPITASKEDEDMIKQLQKTAVMRNTGMAAATLTEAQAEAMKTAAGNSGGSTIGFMGMNMAQNAGGIRTDELFRMDAQQRAQEQAVMQTQQQSRVNSANSWTCSCGAVNNGKFCTECAKPKPAPSGQWTCSCGTVNSGKFCTECAKPKPAPSGQWTCSCGTVNSGKFCTECAKPRPASAPVYKCDKCGWVPDDPKNPPKFCPECGDAFNENDIQ